MAYDRGYLSATQSSTGLGDKLLAFHLEQDFPLLQRLGIDRGIDSAYRQHPGGLTHAEN